MSEWQPIETAPEDGTIVIVGKITESKTFPTWPIEARYVGARWAGQFSPNEWRSFDPQPTHWKPKT